MSFQYVKPTELEQKVMQEFRDQFEALSNTIMNTIEPSRGRSLSLTKLEEAAFWLNKAITKNDN